MCEYTYEPIQEGNGEGNRWDCPHEKFEDSEYCVFHMPEEERREREIDEEFISQKIKENLRDREIPNEYIGVHIPLLRFSYSTVESATTEPLKIKRSVIEKIDFSNCDSRIGMNLSHSVIKGDIEASEFDSDSDLNMNETTVEGDLKAKDFSISGKFTGQNAVFKGNVHFFEAEFEDGIDCSGASFESEAHFDEIDVDEESIFANVTFKEKFSMEASELNGQKHELDDKADFSESVFEDEAHFDDTNFQCLDMCRAEFRQLAVFEGTKFRNNYRARETEFHGKVIFKESDFYRNCVFEEAEFHGKALFSGTEFMGKSRVSDDNINFEEAIFHRRAAFNNSHFSRANFEDAKFRSEADFRDSEFNGDIRFNGSTFDKVVNFDETRFNEDAEFERCRFEEKAKFRGVEFRGDANHISDNVSFEDSVFVDDAEFDSGKFTSANFTNVQFGGECDFENTVFHGEANFEVKSYGDNQMYVDMYEAVLKDGHIKQPGENPTPYDFTKAEIGDVKLSGSVEQHQLLDYFRFCETEFNGFKFEDHHDYLERNGWNIHEFKDKGADINYKLEMTEETKEKTYLKAMSNAQRTGDKRAQSEFQYKKNNYHRSKNIAMVRDSDEPIGLSGKISRFISITQNYTMDYTCGYGTNLPRIVGFLIFTPIVFGALYSVGGPFETSAGSIQTTSNTLAIIGQNIYYSFMSFTTIGYGDISPVAPGSKALASIEGILGAIFSALLIYTLSKGY